MPDSDVSGLNSAETPTDEENVMEKEIEIEGGKLLEVKCGPLYAQMHTELFLCPGIHQPCIELNGEMISPKEFTIRANKDKQKDWKGSIRIGKSNLRTLMEMRSFDFHNHSQLCSAKCQSRNYITPKEKDSESRRGSTNSLRGSSQLSSLFGGGSILGQTHNLGDIFKDSSFSQLMQLTSALNNNNAANLKGELKDEPVDVDDSLTNSPAKPEIRAPEDYVRTMATDPPAFWSDMHDMGIMDDIIDQIVQKLYRIRDQAKMGNFSDSAPVLSNVASSLHADEIATNAIRGKQLQDKIQLEKPRLSSDYSCLEDSDPRKRSIDGSCHSTSSQSSPPVKRPRVQYPMNMLQQSSESVDTKLMQALVQAQMQINQQPPMEFLLQLTNPAGTFADSLIGIKRE